MKLQLTWGFNEVAQSVIWVEEPARIKHRQQNADKRGKMAYKNSFKNHNWLLTVSIKQMISEHPIYFFVEEIISSKIKDNL